ncbi:MAG: hypothetical protein HY619_04040 [Thaumarchaeota archaeon]|nr:hypothetical protein [Nitrososphaerota archaeon]
MPPYSYASLVQKKINRYFRRKRCPVCERVGSGPYKKRVKGKFYLYFAHRFKDSNGKWRIKWHYVGKVD